MRQVSLPIAFLKEETLLKREFRILVSIMFCRFGIPMLSKNFLLAYNSSWAKLRRYSKQLIFGESFVSINLSKTVKWPLYKLDNVQYLHLLTHTIVKEASNIEKTLWHFEIVSLYNASTKFWSGSLFLVHCLNPGSWMDCLIIFCLVIVE